MAWWGKTHHVFAATGGHPRALVERLESRAHMDSGAGVDVVLVDGSLDGYESIVRAAGRAASVVVFDGEKESGAEVLARARGLGERLSSVTIASHGASGMFELGTDVVDGGVGGRLAEAWRLLGAAMEGGADIHLLACSAGAGAAGSRLIGVLAGLTGRDVFASADITGAGGDWELEVSSRGAVLTAPMPLNVASLARDGELTLTVASGNEFLVNSTTANTQAAGFPRAIATDSGGNSVVAWESYGQDALLTYGVYAQRFNAAGVAQGGEFLVNSSVVLNDQRAPALAMNASGDFVIAWEGTGLLGLFPGIYAQRYNAAGVAQGGEIAVAGSALLTLSRAAVAMDDLGNFVVSWEGQDATGQGVYARRFDAGGSALAAEFLVNETTAGNQRAPDVTFDASGNFVVIWGGRGTGDTSGVFARLYDAAGVAQTGETLINTTTGGTQSRPAIAATAGGDFVVAWSGAGTGDTAGIFGRRLGPSLNGLGAELAFNETTAGTQQLPSIAVDVDGDFLVVWSGAGAVDTAGVFGREYSWDGVARTAEYTLSTTATGTQTNASVVSTGDNGYIATWDGNGSGDTAGIFGRRFVNIAPTLTASGGSAGHTEDGGATAVDGALTLADSDHWVLAGATVSITANFVSGEDELTFTDQSGITGSWNGLTGVLTLSGVATVAEYQAALRTVAYLNTSDNPSTLTRTVRFVVTDGTDSSTAGDRNVTVAAANDAPAVVMTASALVFTENGSAAAVDGGLTVTDADSGTLSGAVVSIAVNFVSGEDVLAFTDQSGITGSWNGLTGVLTLTGVATAAQYQAALRSVTYVNGSDDPSTATRTVEVEVTDGLAWSAAATRDISVNAVNDAPTLAVNPSPLGYTENAGGVVIDAALTVGDVDSVTLAGARVSMAAGFEAGEDSLLFTDQAGITGSWNALTGVLTLTGVASVLEYQTALRSVRYMNASEDPSTALRIVEFVVDDGADESLPARRDVSVSPVNDAATVAATASALSYSENAGAVTLDGGVLVGDVDGTTLAGATFAFTGGYVAGQDSLVFSDQGGITGSWSSLTGVLTLSGTATVAAYQAALRSIAYVNGSDNPSTAPRTVEFVVHDGVDASVPATRDIAVTALNDAPVVTVTALTLSYTENAGAVVVDGALALTDVDSLTLAGATVAISAGYVGGEDSLQFTDQSGITGSWSALTGTLTLSGVATVAQYQAALRSITYANGSENPSTATRAVTFVVNDGAADSAGAGRNIAVSAVNDAPVVSTTGAALGFTENDPATAVDGGLTLVDVDSAMLVGATVSITAGYASGQDLLSFTDQSGITGSWNGLTGVLTLTGVATAAQYQAALRSVAYANASDNPSGVTRTVSFAVFDGGLWSAAGTRGVSVTAVNDAPTVQTTASTLAYGEGDGAVVLDAGLLLADVDNLSITGATIWFSAGFVVGEDVLAFADVGGISGSWNALAGVLTLTGTESVASYRAAIRSVTYLNGLENPTGTTRTASVTVTDGTDTSAAAVRDIDVSPVNDAPVVVATATTLTFTENDAATVVDDALAVGDVDTGVLSGAVVWISANFGAGQDVLAFADQMGITGAWNGLTGVLTLSGVASVTQYQAALRTVTYVNGSEDPSATVRTISFEVTDGLVWSAAASRDVAVVAVNDSPVVSGTTGTLAYVEDDGAVVAAGGLVLADVDSGTVAWAQLMFGPGYAAGEDVLAFADRPGITASWNASLGILTLTGTASLSAYRDALRAVTYENTSQDPSTAARTVSIVVFDGENESVGASRAIGVSAVNDAPVAAATGGVLAYSENAGALAIDAGVLLGDVDSAVLTGAVVLIAGNYAAGEDVLTFADMGGISGSWNAALGTLTLSGSAGVAAYQAAVRSVRYVNSSDAPSNLTRTVSIRVSDGALLSGAALRVIAVTPVNDSAVVAVSGAGAVYAENSAAVAVLADITVRDIDSPMLQGATVVIGTGFVAGEDVLSAVGGAGISAAWNGALGVLTLSGSAAVAAYESVLRSVRFETLSENPDTGSRGLVVLVWDGAGMSAPASRWVGVTPVNDAPVVDANGGGAGFVEDGPGVVVAPGLAVGDADSAAFNSATVAITAWYTLGEDSLTVDAHASIVAVWDSAAGELRLSGAASSAEYQALLRTVRYANSSQNPFTLPRVIEFTVFDGAASAAPDAALVTVGAVNDAPLVGVPGGAVGFVEGDSPVPAWPDLSVFDADSGVLQGARVAFGGAFSPGLDVLSASATADIAVGWDGAAGVLTLVGSASVDSYLNVLRSVAFASQGDDPVAGSRIVECSVDDGEAWSVVAAQAIGVAGVNDAPTLALPVTSVTVQAGAGPTAVGGGLTVGDADSAVLTGATVSLAGDTVGSLLTFADTAGITGAWDAAAGVLTLSGDASAAEYQTALRSVMLEGGAAGSSQQVRFSVSDGASSTTGEAVGVSIAERPEVFTPAPPPASAVLTLPRATSPIGSTLAPQVLSVAIRAGGGTLVGERAREEAEMVIRLTPTPATVPEQADVEEPLPRPEPAPEPTADVVEAVAAEPAASSSAGEAEEPAAAEASAFNDEPARDPAMGGPAVSASLSNPVSIPLAAPQVSIPESSLSALSASEITMLHPTLSTDFVSEITSLQAQIQAGAEAAQVASGAVAVTAGGLAVGSVVMAVQSGLFSTLLIPASSPWLTLDPTTYLNNGQSAGVGVRKFFFWRKG